MKIKGQDSSFQSIILEIIREKLNLMVSEVFQLNKKVDFNDHCKLTKIFLKEILKNNIHSVHITKAQAKKFIQIFDKLSCHQEYGYEIDPSSKTHNTYDEKNNPYSSSPFC